MSGGHFDYAQSHIDAIATEVEHLIETNDLTEKDKWGEDLGRHYSPEVIAEFRAGLAVLRRAYIYAKRIDWLVSCDDGPENFLERLKEELAAL